MYETKLIIEADDTDDLPLRFRRTSDPLPDNGREHPSLHGFKELNVSGSGQFSQRGLRRIRREIGRRVAVVVDLRQESHGFVNGRGVSWFGKHNYGNIGLTNEEVRRKEDGQIRGLADAPEFYFDYLEHKSAMRIDEPVRHPKAVHSEEQIAAKEGFGYRRFYVTDHNRPPDKEVDRYILFFKSLSADTWVHYHCRGGVGRTSTFILMHDMLRNAQAVPLEDIFLRNLLNGGRDMRRFYEDQDNYKQAPALERLVFIEQFYAYCRANRDRFATSWSQWLTSQR